MKNESEDVGMVDVDTYNENRNFDVSGKASSLFSNVSSNRI